MEINLIREQSITVRTRLPSTSAKQATFRGNAGLLRAGRGGADPLWAGREGLVWAGTGRGKPWWAGRADRKGRGGWSRLAPLLRGCSLLPSPLDSSCRGWTTTCLDRSGGPDQGGRPGSGRHLLLHQKQAVHVTSVGAPRVGLERGGTPRTCPVLH